MLNWPLAQLQADDIPDIKVQDGWCMSALPHWQVRTVLRTFDPPERCSIASISAVKRRYAGTIVDASCADVVVAPGTWKKPRLCAARSSSSGIQASNKATAASRPGSRWLRSAKDLGCG